MSSTKSAHKNTEREGEEQSAHQLYGASASEQQSQIKYFMSLTELILIIEQSAIAATADVVLVIVFIYLSVSFLSCICSSITGVIFGHSPWPCCNLLNAGNCVSKLFECFTCTETM